MQQKFGQDFSDLVSLIENTRQRHPKGKKEEHSSSMLQYRLQGKMKGFSIGLEGGSSAIFLECERIGGAVVQNGSGISGHIELSDCHPMAVLIALVHLDLMQNQHKIGSSASMEECLFLAKKTVQAKPRDACFILMEQNEILSKILKSRYCFLIVGIPTQSRS